MNGIKVRVGIASVIDILLFVHVIFIFQLGAITEMQTDKDSNGEEGTNRWGEEGRRGER